MKIPRTITIGATASVAAVLAATGIAMAAPVAPALPGPATATMTDPVSHMSAGAGPRTGWMGEGDAGDANVMAEMHADGGMSGDMAATHSQMGAMHGDAGQMAQHHTQMLERDPQLRQRHDEMMDRYPAMQDHVNASPDRPRSDR